MTLGLEGESLGGAETTLDGLGITFLRGVTVGGAEMTFGEIIALGAGEVTSGWSDLTLAGAGVDLAGILAVLAVGATALFWDIFLAAPFFTGVADFRLDTAGVLTFLAAAGTGLEAVFGGLPLVLALGAAGFPISACGLRALG